MRHDDSLYFRWLRAESRCRSLSHGIYTTAQAGCRPTDAMLRDFFDAVETAHAASRAYLAHVSALAAWEPSA